MSIVGHIYRVTNTVNGKRYVGYTKLTVGQRWKRHLGDARKGSPYLFHKALRKYGEASFSVETLETIEGVHADLVAAEIRHIADQGCVSPLGYNLTNGGEGVDLSIPEVRERYMAAVRKRSADPVYRDRLAQGLKDWYADPTHREATAEIAKKRSQDPAWQAANREQLRQQHADPSWQAANSEGLKKAWVANSTKAATRDAHLPPEEQARRARRREQGRRHKAEKRSMTQQQVGVCQ